VAVFTALSLASVSSSLFFSIPPEQSVGNPKGKGTKPRRDPPQSGLGGSKIDGSTSAHPQASAGPRHTTSASAPQNETPPTQGNARSAEPPTPKHARENPQNSASPQSKKKQGKRRLTHKTTAHFHRSVWPWRA
jgi:hypothetical protein